MTEISFKADSTTGKIAGYASVFDHIDGQGDAVKAGAFLNSIADYHGKGYMPPLLWQHKQDEPIGSIDTLTEDSTGLWLEGTLAMGTTRGREAFELLTMGSIGSMSIGWRSTPGGEKMAGGVRELNNINLMEVSVVTTPANELARVHSVKHLESKTELEQLLRKAGLSRTAAKAVTARGYSGLDQSHAGEDLSELTAKLNNLSKILKG